MGYSSSPFDPFDPSASASRTRLAASRLAGPEARKFVRSVLTEQTAPRTPGAPAITERLMDDALLLVDELVTNAVLHAGTDIEVVCRLQEVREPAVSDQAPGATAAPQRERCLGVVVEVVDHHPSSGLDTGRSRAGRGLRLVASLSESWGVTYRHTQKAVWFRLLSTQGEKEAVPRPAGVPGARHELDAVRRPGAAAPAAEMADPAARTVEWVNRGGLSFLAEAGELLAGQLDADMVAALAGQLLVPRVADWCAVWLGGEHDTLRLSRVWHSDEQRIGALRRALQDDPPPTRLTTPRTPRPWPDAAGDPQAGGSALAFPLLAGGTCQGMLVIGRSGAPQMTDAVAKMVEDVSRLVAQALITARQYTLQTTISRALQRKQLPDFLARIPGVETAIVYEPYAEGQIVGGDFYDLFPVGDRRWCFMLGDVEGKDPEAMSVTGLVRRLVRLLARDGHSVESVLHKLNTAMLEESAETLGPDGEPTKSRFLSLLYGDLEPTPDTGGARCRIASAGHPLPLRLTVDGEVVPPVGPQLLLGVDENTRFRADSFDLAPGETLLCVTDGVTERRSGNRELDDDNGLAQVLAECTGLGAMAVAEHVRRAAHDFDARPVADDLAVLVLHALPHPSPML